jgi:hypothetical protein
MVSSGNIKNNNHKPKWERGQAFVLVALGTVALIAVIGLATDAAMIYKTKQDLQRAIDSAALAGAYKLPKQNVAEDAVYEFMRLHGYNFVPITNPLQISFPNNDVQKIVHVEGTTNANYFFLRILGFNTMTVSAAGEGEAAPMDIYLVFDLSQSMVYDLTTKPNPWPTSWPVGFPTCNSGDWDPYPGDSADCVAKYCNAFRKCDPLDKYIKPAANYFIDQLDSRYDRVGVVSYDQFGVKVIGLSSNFNAVKTAIGNMNAFDHQGGSSSLCPNTSPATCNKNTNIGDGIKYAHDNIALEGRLDSIWSIVLMTDGRTNIARSCSGCPPNCGALACNTLYVDLSEPAPTPEAWAINNAKDTWTRHETVVYTIAYGEIFFTNPDYQDLMIEIADWTDNGVQNGTTENFWPVPDANGLRAALLEIAQRIYARLLQ